MSLGADLFQSSPLFLTPSLFFPLTSPSPTFWPHSVIGFVPLYFAILPDHGPETKVPTDYWTEIAKKHGQSKSCLLSRFPLVVPMQRGYASTNLSLILERRLSWETFFHKWQTSLYIYCISYFNFNTFDYVHLGDLFVDGYLDFLVCSWQAGIELILESPPFSMKVSSDRQSTAHKFVNLGSTDMRSLYTLFSTFYRVTF